MSEKWERVGRLFEEIAGAPAAARESMLAASPESEDIKNEVGSLLAAHERAEGFLERPGGDALPSGESQPSMTRALPDASPLLESNAMVGPYRIKGVAGRGGMGVVYDAEDTRLHRRVALKALPAAFAGVESQRLRLRQEARAAAALQHPGIATVYALEEIDGGLFISSEFLDGETLRSEMARGPRSIEHALNTAAAMASALCAAHERGIVHRDLKPENVVRTANGGLKVLDFGLAQFEEAAHDLASRSRLTEQGLLIGTPAYMAPEQLLGQPTDFRVDQFALGVMLYELCVGSHPFGDGSLPSTIARILASPPRVPAQPQRLPPPVWAVVDRLLQKDPAHRYPVTRQLLEELTQLATEAHEMQGGEQGQVQKVQKVQGVQGVQVPEVHAAPAAPAPHA